LKIGATLPHNNISAHCDYVDYYNQASHALVVEIYKEDFALFGYRKDLSDKVPRKMNFETI
jgi:hypothetical protein